jgi:hypothetical protein
VSFVFVSHASEDKQRIAEHLRELLSYKLPLWIDRAHELGPEFDRQGRIALGEAWPSSISRALDEAACVLLFWSRDAIKPEKSVLHREANTGLREKKLVQVALDDGVMSKVHPLFSELQVEAFYKLGSSDEFRRAYRRLADAIAAKFATWRAQQHADMGVPPHLLPFVVDRQPQLDRICGDFAQHLRRLSSRDTARPLEQKPAYVIFALNEDCPDRLSERLGRLDGPEICEVHGYDDWRLWDDEIVLKWPSEKDTSPDRMRARVEAVLDRHAGRLDRPRCVVSHIERIRPNEYEFVCAWLESWHRYFGETPESPLIPLLTIDHGGQDWFGSKRRLARLRQALADWRPGVQGQTARVAPVLLDELSPISYDDAKSWARRIFRSGPKRMAVDNFVDYLFKHGSHSMRMAGFATSVRSTGWFKEIAGELTSQR